MRARFWQTPRCRRRRPSPALAQRCPSWSPRRSKSSGGSPLTRVGSNVCGPCFGHISRATRVPDQYIEFTPISRLRPSSRRGVGSSRSGRMERRGFAWRREGASGALRGAPVAPYGADLGADHSRRPGRLRRMQVDFGEIPRYRRGATGRRAARRCARTAGPAGGFPAVHDIPPPRNSVTLTNPNRTRWSGSW